MKEIHFYTNLCNEEQISDKLITDVLVDFVSTKKAIDSGDECIRTTQLALLRESWDFIDKGYKVYIHNGNSVMEVQEHMPTPDGKDIRRGHEISRILIGGGFGELC